MSVDVVYTIGRGSKWQNNELRYAIRALEKHFLDLGRIFVCGVCPPWLRDVIHLDVRDSHAHNKDANMIDKVLAACKGGVSDLFVRSSDDEFLMRPVHVGDLFKYHGGDLKLRPDSFWSSDWKRRLKRTMKALEARGLPTIHYDTHIPTVYNRDLFMRVAAEFDYTPPPGYTINTLYCNNEGLVDPPPIDGMKLTLERPVSDVRKIRKQLEGKQYLGFNDAGLTHALKSVLAERFPSPSRFEVMSKEFVAAAPQVIPEIVVVLGSPRSGTSCVAGIVHRLGISMGKYLKPPTDINPRGFYEALSLKKICEAVNDTKATRVQKLRRWAATRAKDGPMIGGKYGKLCNYVPAMVQAWPRLRAIAVERPLPEIVASMSKSGLYKHGNMARMESWATKCISNRDRNLAALGVQTMRLEYHAVLANPSETVQKLIDFMGISPTPEQRADAIAFVEPSLQHERTT